CFFSNSNKMQTAKLASRLGIEQYYPEIFLQDKAEIIREFQESGHHVCYVGDGLGDLKAFKQADVSVSFGGATASAIDNAQVILLQHDIGKLVKLMEISKDFNSNLNKIILSCTLPSTVILGGVFIFHMGLLFALSCYFVGMLASVGVAISPKLNDLIQPVEN
ncbi:MAG: hypothetical protein AAF518_10620, partial [Spirochaetota bacterium]